MPFYEEHDLRLLRVLTDRGTEYYHYDHRNRLTEKKIPGKGWEYLIYNKLDQVVATQDAEQRKSSQWVVTKYDALGRMVMTGLSTIAGNREAVQAAQSLYEQSNPNSLWESYTGTGNGYSQSSWPGSLSTELSINYYDQYNFPGNTYGGPSGGQSSGVKGYQTGSKVNVLGTSTMLLSVNYYDEDGRVVQSKADNYVGGSDIVTITYSFTGQLLTSTRQHTSSNASATVATRYVYDHMGRKKETYENINNQGEVKLSALSYAETGQLLSKSLHNNNQSTGYTYNERGWLKNSTSSQFSFQLNYQDGSIPQYNGNISNQLWGASAPNANTFTYSYDRLNRLTSGAATGMSEALTYDEMGNIKSMNRDGQFGQYIYTGNRLDLIVNGALATQTYRYDDNGNVTYDGRNQKTIGYNILNLPQTVSGGISYTYDATGRKLKNQSSTTTHYVDGIQYTGDSIDFIQTEEGRALNMAGTYKYEYNLSDHLGNVRYSFDIYNGTVRRIQQDDYYAFGKRTTNYPGSPDNKYLYNGKELQEELGTYDYGQRQYDPVIGRFNVVDRYAEKYSSYTPYHYGLNNPIRNIDVNGDSVVVLSAPHGAGGAGHMAILIQNKKGEYSLWSKNGTNDHAKTYGANNKGDQAGVGSFKSPEEFMKSKLNPVINSKTGEREYSEGFLIPATAKEDRAAEAGAKKELAKDYNVLGSNCACTVQSALESGGKKDGSPSVLSTIVTGVISPAAAVVQEKTPNLIYERIKKQNEDGKVIKH